MFTTFRITFTHYNKMCFSNPYHMCRFTRHKCSKTFIKGPPWRILFFGTDDFSLQSLRALYSKLRTGTLISSLGVVTKKNSIVCKFSNDEKLPLYYWPLKPSQIHSQYDIGMVVSFGNLITKAIIEALPLGCINVHASILPRWRGAAPIIHAILAGDNETGVTIMRIHPHKFDVGEIVRQYRAPISWNETAYELEKRLSTHGSQLLMECVRDLPKCVQMAVPQPDIGVTYAPKVDHSLSIIDWRNTTAQGLFNMHRALSHLNPLKTCWHGQTVKLLNLSLDLESKKHLKQTPEDTESSYKSALDFLNNSGEKDKKPKQHAEDAGRCLYVKDSKTIKIECADGQQVVVNKLQVANKGMTAIDFYNGYMTKRKKNEWVFTKAVDN